MEIQNATLASLSVDGRGSYGIGASAVERTEDLYTYLRITDIRDDGTLNMADLKSVDDEKASQYLLKPNDIVFARTGASTGRNYFYDGTDGEFVYAGFLIKFSIDPNKVNPKYVKYYCMSDAYKGWIHSFNTGSTRGNINAQTLGGMPVPIPPRSQQDGIVDILSSLEKKIRKNTEINDNLEQQAQALFKKMFPDVLEDTASDCFESIISFSNGKKRPQSGGSVPVYGGNGILAYTSEVNANNCVVIGRVGAYCGNTFLCQGNCWVSDNAIQAKSKNEDSQIFVYYLLKNASLPTRHIGTGQPLMTQGILNAIPVSVPEQNAINNFIDNVSPMHKLISANLEENSKLAKTRDILLPQLMSGELDVSEIDI